MTDDELIEFVERAKEGCRREFVAEECVRVSFYDGVSLIVPWGANVVGTLSRFLSSQWGN